MTERIMLIGDTHGDGDWVETCLRRAAELGITTGVQLGDFGLRSGPTGEDFIDHVSISTRETGVTLYALTGNHDNASRIAELEQHRDADGFVTISSPRVAGGKLRWIPRGHRWTWCGVNFGALGGAFSVDHRFRTADVNWWPVVEEVQPADIDTLGPESLDVILSHEAPEGADPPSMFRLDLHDQVQSRQSRLLLRSGVETTRPALVVHGHWHVRQSRVLKLNGGSIVRVEGLTSNHEADGTAWAVLELPSLEFRDGRWGGR
jgi:predicted phosphodiesterase